ncbi:MAG: carbon starvation protein A [Planctomycetaceae bacterium]|nr:carbon starvation protein A [Planctomycetaceae bacterium]
MLTLAVAVFSFFAFILAYNTYGRWLSQRIFQVDPKALVPAKELQDDVDFVPTDRQVLFGHHFTSIAGTGPIVGPAIAVFWGWLPALLWVVLGSIFVGAVHDFGALFVSLRNRGQTIGEVAGRLINWRARLLFLFILFFALTIVLAIFGLVIASIFKEYPESVLSVWVAMPLAMLIGYWVYQRKGSLLLPSLIALAILYLCVYLGVYYFPFSLPDSVHIAGSPVVTWTVVLMAYCFVASVLPVWLLLQPRDYINSHQLVVALALLVAGLAVAGLTGQADLAAAAPAIAAADEIPVGAPPIFPFLFITIACGACSGFHCLVSSGTSSKQISSESDAQFVGYGSMLMEGALAVIVILACCAGVGMGRAQQGDEIVGLNKVENEQVELVTGRQAWRSLYAYGEGQTWSSFNLAKKVSAFVEGGANFLSTIGMPHKLAIGIIAVLVACFAATTLDTATRLQRYVIQELGTTLKVPPLANKYGATFLAVALGTAVAMIPASAAAGPGTGGLILWPLFGATNQLLAGLAFLVLIFYLARRGKSVMFAVIPAVMMTSLPVIGLGWQIFGDGQWFDSGRHLLVGFGVLILALQAWMVIEAIVLYPKVRGVLEESLPPLPTAGAESAAPNC